MSSDRAARSSENWRARGSSATRGGGAGTLASVRRSPPLAEALRIRPTTKRVQEGGRISLFLVHRMRQCPEPTTYPIVPIDRGKYKSRARAPENRFSCRFWYVGQGIVAASTMR